MFRTERYIKYPVKSYQCSNAFKAPSNNSPGTSNKPNPADEQILEWISKRRVIFGLLSMHRVISPKPLPNPTKVNLLSSSRSTGAGKVIVDKGLRLLCDLYGPIQRNENQTTEKPSTVRVDELSQSSKKPEQKEVSGTLFDLSALEQISRRMSRRGSLQLQKGRELMRPPLLRTMQTTRTNDHSESESSDDDSLSSDDDQTTTSLLKCNVKAVHSILKKSRTSVLPSIYSSRRFSLVYP